MLNPSPNRDSGRPATGVHCAGLLLASRSPKELLLGRVGLVNPTLPHPNADGRSWRKGGCCKARGGGRSCIVVWHATSQTLSRQPLVYCLCSPCCPSPLRRFTTVHACLSWVSRARCCASFGNLLRAAMCPLGNIRGVRLGARAIECGCPVGAVGWVRTRCAHNLLWLSKTRV